MIWLGKTIILDTSSIDIAVLIFSILSLAFSIITILIYFNVKYLRTVIYRLFFQIAINESINRFAHILHYINLSFNNSIFFCIYIILIYFTDLNILILSTFSCYAMYEQIIKQNRNLNNNLSLIIKIFYGFSIIVTIVFFIVSIVEHVNDRDIELIRNVIALNFIKDSDVQGNKLAPLLLTSILYFLLVVYGFFKIFAIQIFIRKRGDMNEVEEEINESLIKRHKSLKLISFKNKMMQYPLLGLFFFLPLISYTMIEYFKGDNKEDNLSYLRIRFLFYNINCFINSIRGCLYFKVFISNEKIKMFLFKKYLKSSIFYSIDKIILKGERSLQNNNKKGIVIQGADGTQFLEGTSYDNNNNNIGRINSTNIDNNNDEQLIDFINKEKSFADYNFNCLEDDDDNEIQHKSSHDSKSETLKIKGHQKIFK